MYMGRCHKVYGEMSKGVYGDVLRCMGRCPKVHREMS